MWQRLKKTMAAAAITAMPFAAVTCNVPNSITLYGDDYYGNDHGFFDYGYDSFDFGYDFFDYGFYDGYY